MKKFSLKDLNVDPKKKLSRSQLKNIFAGDMGSGGSSYCVITVEYPWGNPQTYETPTTGGCSNQSSQANQQCLTMIGSNVGQIRCHYDCACDGLGH